MSQVATASSTFTSGHPNKMGLVLKALTWIGIVALAVVFVRIYVFRYYLNYNEVAFNDVSLGGAPNYWVMRGWLLLHISSGMLALLAGPWQFWTGLRKRHMRIHRWTGRLFLTGVAIGSLCAIRLAVSTTFGWAWGFGVGTLAFAWITTTSMAYYAILKRQLQIHKEWMIRAYVVTFAFVTFRLFSDFGPTSKLQPDNDRFVTIIWFCWSVPLLITEVLLQLRRMGTSQIQPAR
jgi:uncharacterized membrane protein YozB (DUF420 family)